MNVSVQGGPIICIKDANDWGTHGGPLHGRRYWHERQAGRRTTLLLMVVGLVPLPLPLGVPLQSRPPRMDDDDDSMGQREQLTERKWKTDFGASPENHTMYHHLCVRRSCTGNTWHGNENGFNFAVGCGAEKWQLDMCIFS